MKAWKIILAALVLFAAGVATGTTVTTIRARAAHKAELAKLAKRSPLPPTAWQRFDFLRRAQRDLNLSEDQKTRIDALLKESQDHFRKLWEPVAPQVKVEFDALRDRIRAQLTAEQQQRFDELLKKPERRWSDEKRRSRDGDKDDRKSGDSGRDGVKSDKKD